MITDAVWIDFDGDGRLDLVTVGEWMPIQFYRNEGKTFRNVTSATGLPLLRGWWFSLAVGDFDHDGRPDLIAGNLGLNYSYTTSQASKFGVYASDFTGNGGTDIVLTQEIEGTEYPLAGLAPLGRQIYPLAIRFPTYGSFAEASIRELFSPTQLQQALHYQTDTFASVYVHNDGNGHFTLSALPNLAQIAPIKGIVIEDVDHDDNLDLVVAGNLYDTEPNTARVLPSESGLLAPRNVTGLVVINTAAGKTILVANSADSLQAFAITKR
jgi:hypothetical protein